MWIWRASKFAVTYLAIAFKNWRRKRKGLPPINDA